MYVSSFSTDTILIFSMKVSGLTIIFVSTLSSLILLILAADTFYSSSFNNVAKMLPIKNTKKL